MSKLFTNHFKGRVRAHSPGSDATLTPHNPGNNMTAQNTAQQQQASAGATAAFAAHTRRAYITPATTRHAIRMEEPCIMASPQQGEDVINSTITPVSGAQSYSSPTELDFSNADDYTWD